MHELSFAQQVLECVEHEAAVWPGSRVTRVRMRSGALLALEPASLRFALECISAGTVAEGAVFECFASEDDPGADLVVEEIELDEQDDPH